jgi:hypothetical protein
MITECPDCHLYLVQHVCGLDGGGGTVFDAELYVDLFEVLVHRAGRQAEDIADIAVGFALGDPDQHFGSACDQAIERICMARCHRDQLNRLMMFCGSELAI